MAPAGNKAKRLSSVSHTTKTIHHHVLDIGLDECELRSSHHLAMFGSHWSSANEDITYLICRVTSHCHTIERSWDMGGSS